MKLTLFKNMKGLIHGSDPKRISCEEGGVLKIGKIEVTIDPAEVSIMPMLFNGCTGNFDATFTTLGGAIYNLEKVVVKDGWIQPPPPTTVELMELRYRADKNEKRIEVLEGIFDTNSLNFLIK